MLLFPPVLKGTEGLALGSPNTGRLLPGQMGGTSSSVLHTVEQRAHELITPSLSFSLPSMVIILSTSKEQVSASN